MHTSPPESRVSKQVWKKTEYPNLCVLFTQFLREWIQTYEVEDSSIKLHELYDIL